ncbi:hypothetical protein AVEN_78265-1, partial [Araneus ventricosus]
MSLLRQLKNKGQFFSPSSTPKSGLHSGKPLLSVWWNTRGLISFELLKKGSTADLSCQQLNRVDQAPIEKHPSLVDSKG